MRTNRATNVESGYPMAEPNADNSSFCAPSDYRGEPQNEDALTFGDGEGRQKGCAFSMMFGPQRHELTEVDDQ